MKKSAKILLAVIAALLCVAVVVFAVKSASPSEAEIIKENFGSLAADAADDPEAYVMNDTSLSNLSDLQFLNAININNESDRNQSDTVSFPIMVNGKIEMIFSYTDKGSNASLGKDFAPLLEALRADGASEAYIIQKDYTFYGISGDTVYKQSGQSVTKLDNSQTVVKVSSDMEITDLTSVNNDYTEAARASLNT